MLKAVNGVLFVLAILILVIKEKNKQECLLSGKKK